MDLGVLAALIPLGVEPGKIYDASKITDIDGKRFRKMSQKTQQKKFSILATGNPADYARRMLRPKGKADLQAMALVSVLEPLGLPIKEIGFYSIKRIKKCLKNH